MTVTVEIESDSSSWNRYVEQSSQAGVFHRYNALSVQADHADAVVHRYVGHTDGDPLGVFPVFELRHGFITTAFSPPPNLRVPYLGPALLNADSWDHHDREHYTREFVEAVLNRTEASIGPWYVHLRTSDCYTDIRPLVWQGFESRSRHTYVVDLSVGPDDLMSSFSNDARSNVTGTDEDAYEITVEGDEAIRDVFRQVRQRYESQDIDFAVPTEFAVDLFEQLPDGVVRPYVLRTNGEFVGGILVLDDGNRVSRWQGGVRVDSDLPANDLLDWHVMTDAIDRDRTEYDLVGADNERISDYKAKFAPELRSFTSMWCGSPAMSLLVSGYRKLT